MLCMMSAFKILNPDVIYFHTNIPPIGPYWDRVLKLPTLKVTLGYELTTCLLCRYTSWPCPTARMLGETISGKLGQFFRRL